MGANHGCRAIGYDIGENLARMNRSLIEEAHRHDTRFDDFVGAVEGNTYEVLLLLGRNTAQQREGVHGAGKLHRIIGKVAARQFESGQNLSGFGESDPRAVEQMLQAQRLSMLSNQTGDLKPNFLGRVQPYAVYVPRSYRRAHRSRLVWILHSLGVQHNQYGALSPNLVKGMCERPKTVCATTLGRGPDGWYVDEAELDFFEVWGALARAYRLDARRTAVTGYSMGGFGSYRFGLGYPDLFSQAISLAGPPGIGLRAAWQPRRRLAQAARSAISFLVSAIALAGFSPLGQTLAQFMIVWQR